MMRLMHNFMDRVTGIDISPSSVRIVELGRLFRKIVLLRYDEQNLDPFYTPDKSLGLACRRLYDRAPGTARDAAAHLEGKGVRHLIAQAPLLDADSLETWVIAQVMQRLPEGISVSDLSITYQLLNRTEDGLQLWITYCQLQRVNEQIGWTRNAGLDVITLGGGTLDVHLALLSTDETAAEKPTGCILIREDSIHCSIAVNGQPAAYEEIPMPGEMPDSGKIFNLCVKRWQEQGKLNLHHVAWIDARTLENESDQLPPPEGKTLWPVEVPHPLQGAVENAETLPARFSQAAGLALKHFYPALNTLNLLPHEAKERVREKREKQFTLRLILAAGGLLTLLLFGLNAWHTSVEEQLNASEEQVIAFNDQINAIEITKREQGKLAETLQDMRHLVRQRSDDARLLEEISRVTPEDVWLESLLLEPVYEGRMREQKKTGDRMTVQGWALSDTRITRLISGLERSSLFKDVLLEEREQLSEEAVFKRTEQVRRPLIHFRVTLSLASAAAQEDRP